MFVTKAYVSFSSSKPKPKQSSLIAGYSVRPDSRRKINYQSKSQSKSKNQSKSKSTPEKEEELSIEEIVKLCNYINPETEFFNYEFNNEHVVRLKTLNRTMRTTDVTLLKAYNKLYKMWADFLTRNR